MVISEMAVSELFYQHLSNHFDFSLSKGKISIFASQIM